MVQVSKVGSNSVSLKQLVKLSILKEVFLAGSLLKSEIAQALSRQAARNKKSPLATKSLHQLQTLADEACDELTQENLLIGVTAHSGELKATDPMEAALGEQNDQATGSKKKREAKKARKDAEKEKSAAVRGPLQTSASEAALSAETPLRLNFAIFVAQERHDAVLAFAERKFAPPPKMPD